MNYLAWSLIALLAYALVAPMVSVATQEIPSDVVVATTNGILVLAAFGLVLYTRVPVQDYLTHDAAPYMYGAGILLAIAIIAYYRALEAGPVTVVVPIFGMFIVFSSIVGFVFLDEPLTLRKGVGIGLAAVAVWLTAT